MYSNVHSKLNDIDDRIKHCWKYCCVRFWFIRKENRFNTPRRIIKNPFFFFLPREPLFWRILFHISVEMWFNSTALYDPNRIFSSFLFLSLLCANILTRIERLSFKNTWIGIHIAIKSIYMLNHWINIKINIYHRQFDPIQC